MQTQLLSQEPSDSLRVYAIWLPMLWGDSRSRWDGRTMSDSRVAHYWDQDHVVGEWFAQQVDGYTGIAWDVYYLYGPGATWGDLFGPLVGSGRTIYSERRALGDEVQALLNR